jgi:alpha-galactosidase
MALIAFSRSHAGHYRPDNLRQKRRLCSARQGGKDESILAVLAFAAAFMAADCGRTPPPGPGQSARRSQVAVSVNKAGPVIVTSPQAEFRILPSGYVQAFLLKDGKGLSLDEPGAAASFPGDILSSAGREIRDFSLDLAHPKVADAAGRLGPAGRRVEIPGRSASVPGVGMEFTLEVYDDFPTIALMTVGYRNNSTGELTIDRVSTQRHLLNAALADPKAPPFDLWSFQGSSYDWGKPDVLRISAGFSQPNMMGGPGAQGLGGGIPVIDFWGANVGEAIGHLETLPLVLSLPVEVRSDGRVGISMALDPEVTLNPGEAYSTPWSFVMVHSGDYYDSLRLWSRAKQRQGWTLPKPNDADYGVNWCGWGYDTDFTPAQMLGTIPKLKELGIQWATLDFCWFDSFGDWNPRRDTFPGDAVKKLVDEFHRQGIKITLWWQPLTVEGLRGKDSLGKPITTSSVMKEHPDWLILDEAGKPARYVSPVSGMAVMCPALPEVRAYHKALTERFMRDWGFDGNKMDSIFTVPPCYNPKHHHKSPDDSIYAMQEVYRVIFDTTRALKPDSVTQICPCGTVPNMAYLPYMDQAVTADPVGAEQVRRRIKMYKALLGPTAAVYGDHVELSDMKKVGEDYIESGRDFASTVGAGGVIGTKFTWPGDAPNPQSRNVRLTPEKEAHWKKWIDIYNARMLSRGEFRNLYVCGYDVPEGYAIEKDGKTYYAFFSPDPGKPWRGEIELRGLQPGRYRITDFENGMDLGLLDAQLPFLKTEFTGHLLLEARSN